MQKILVLRGGALGDFIVTLPALALLRQRWPGARIELAGNSTAAALALARGLLDAVHSQHEARWAALYGGDRLTEDFGRWLGEFDLVVNFWPDPDGELKRRFPRHSRQLFVSGPAMPTRAPAAAHYCEPLHQLGLATREYFFPLHPLARLPAPRDDEVGRIAIHPGSGSPRKNWPVDHWRRLIARLPSPVMLLIGEAEATTWATFPAPNVAAVVSAPLEDLVNHLSRCALFLGHDSGVSHLAAACGVPCVLLFGPTEPAIWAPPVPHVRVLRHDGDLRMISVEEVLHEVRSATGNRR